MGQPTFNPTRTYLIHGLSELDSIQLTCEKIEFFSTQPGTNLWWAGLAHKLEPLLTSLIRILRYLKKALKQGYYMKIKEAFRSLSIVMQIGQVRLLTNSLLLHIVFSLEETLFHGKLRNRKWWPKKQLN